LVLQRLINAKTSLRANPRASAISRGSATRVLAYVMTLPSQRAPSVTTKIKRQLMMCATAWGDAQA
jgi:hypothetical protein